MRYSLDSYRLIIKQALSAGWTFSSFTLNGQHAPKHVYLRHDVDYSPAMALELARVNAELKVAGTFFFLPHSHTYNLFSAGAQNTVRQIDELGQHVALHTALSSTNDIEVRLSNDFQFVKSYLPMISSVFSWHNPTADVLERHLHLECLAGLVNVYAARFMRDITYASDSNMRHSADYFFALFEEPKGTTLQLLLHPLNWVAGGSNMREVFAGTWPYVIREKEQEMLSNRYYRGMFPSGMPDAVLQAFTERWLHAVECETH